MAWHGLQRLSLTLALTATCLWGQACFAAPPVRIAVVSGNANGIEQEIVDRIVGQISNMSDVVVSTVNPDWYVLCNINENLDQVSGSIRYNGSIIFKTAGGQVLNTVAVQKYNQDFSVSGGAQLNKRLVDNAAREVVNSASSRIIQPIQTAVIIEMETRDRIIKAQTLGDQDKYEDALSLLRPITPDTPHFKDVRDLIDEMEMEEDAMERLNSAESKAKAGRLGEAIATAKGIPSKSKRYRQARAKIGSWNAILARKKHH